jgi:NADPH2:quinone reductase
MRADLWPAVEAGKLSLPIHKVLPLERVADALAHDARQPTFRQNRSHH